MDQKNPLHIRILYTSALIVQTFDVYSFVTLSSFFWPKREDLSCPTSSFFLRAYSTLLLPFIILVFRLRGYHIRHTDVGRAVGGSFMMFHVLAPAWYAWSRFVMGGYVQEPFWVIMTVHCTWAAWAAYGLVAAT